MVVTNESAQRLASVFSDYFDMIVLDAPCSGEGMFRKDPDAIQYWSKTILLSVRSCKRKSWNQLLKCLHLMDNSFTLPVRGRLKKNEDIVRWLLEQYALELIDIPKQNGMVEGIGYPETALDVSSSF